MDGGVTANKCEHASHDTDKKGQSLRGPPAQVQELGKHLLGRAVVGHIRDGDQDGEESQDVEEQDQALEPREQFSSAAIDANGKRIDGPEE